VSSTILPPRPKPLQTGVLVRESTFGRERWALALDERPTPRPPPPLRNADIPPPSSGGAEWSEWADARGYGFRSWLSWVWNRGDGLTPDEQMRSEHLRLERRRDCHQYQRIIYCYHTNPHVHPELRNVPTDKPIAKEGKRV
jgi:hypothetical protein